MEQADPPAKVASNDQLGVTYTLDAGGDEASTTEMVESLGQEWLKVPAAWEWGLDDFLIVHAGKCRLILCRIEKFTSFSGPKPVRGGIRKVPIKVGELDIVALTPNVIWKSD